MQNLVLVELKSLERMAPVHRKVVLTYLRLSGVRLGLLVNFGAPVLKDGFERLVNGLDEQGRAENGESAENVMIGGELVPEGNDADGDGGGLWLGPGSLLVGTGESWHARIAGSEILDGGVRVQNNTATNGAGIAIGVAAAPAQIAIEFPAVLENDATGLGGGLWVPDSPAMLSPQLTFESAWFNGNTAVGAGGGIALAGRRVRLTLSSSCSPQWTVVDEIVVPDVYLFTWFDRSCAEVTDNVAETGAGMWIGTASLPQSISVLGGVRFQDNVAVSLVGVQHLQVLGAGVVSAQNVLAAGGAGGVDAIQVAAAARLGLSHVTVADNQGAPARYLGNVGNISRSLFQDAVGPGGLDLPGAGVQGTCNTGQGDVASIIGANNDSATILWGSAIPGTDRGNWHLATVTVTPRTRSSFPRLSIASAQRPTTTISTTRPRPRRARTTPTRWSSTSPRRMSIVKP